MSFLRKDDLATLAGVNPLLSYTVVKAAEIWATEVPSLIFRVTDGLRTIEVQRRLLRAGKTKTLDSKHLTGNAVDLALLASDRSRALWDFELYRELDACMQRAFATIPGRDGRTLFWGGHWPTLRDGVHWQLERQS